MTESANETRVVTSIEELVRDVTVELLGITFYKVSAELSSELDSDDPVVEDLTPTYGLKLLAEGTEIGVRLSLHLEGSIGTVEIDAAVNYVTPFPVAIPEAIRLEFANEVGIMALLPFVRETVWSITQRVFGSAVVMPLIQRGELSFTQQEQLPTE